MQLTAVDCQSWLNDFSKKIEVEKDYLSELDTPIGDGDHGNNMARGMTAYQEMVKKQAPETIADTLKTMSMALISKVGGASGPLYGSAFLNMAKAAKNLDTINSEKELGQLINEGLVGIQHRGKAEAGDKTMVDVWLPVTAALQAGKLTDETIQQAVASTKELVAKKGRASYLGERAIGHIDPGAYSSGLLFSSLLPFIKK